MIHDLSDRRRLARVGRALGLRMDGRWSVRKMFALIQTEVFGPPPPIFRAGDKMIDGIIVRKFPAASARKRAKGAERLRAAEALAGYP
jgi:hypothetical protein